MPSSLFPSFMRTVVPIAAGLVLSWLGRTGLDLFGSAQVTMWVTAALTAAYYAVFRLAEAWATRIGWGWLRTVAGVLLGWARPPQYPATPSASSTTAS
ncbi:hypothetical protein ABZX77_30605 [Streptomyces sp. NPDC004237]|uniref:hypothetical protein n=1 Tax=Streptomyces sp. NPDC004237 TaxID=3154455 RepID=UPI0033B30A53